MRLNAKHNWKLKLGILLFLIGQAFSLAHASEHGSAPHAHDGVACVGVLTDEHDLLIPRAGLAAPAVNAIASKAIATGRTLFPKRARALQPPATGPPSI